MAPGTPVPPPSNRDHTGATWPTSAAAPAQSAIDCHTVTAWFERKAMGDVSRNPPRPPGATASMTCHVTVAMASGTSASIATATASPWRPSGNGRPMAKAPDRPASSSSRRSFLARHQRAQGSEPSR